MISSKDVIGQWFIRNDITFDPKETKVEMIQHVRKSQPQKVYKIDQIAYHLIIQI